MSKKSILLLGAFIALFARSSFCQSFVQDISSYQSITLENFAKLHSELKFSVRESYEQEDFVRVSKDLERLYFNDAGQALKTSDSLSVLNDFKKLPRSLSIQYRKETKKLVKKLKRFNAGVSSVSDYVVEPRYLIKIEAPNPLAYTLSLEYVLIDRPKNKIYRIIF